MRRSRRGMTLLEMMIVVTVMLITATVVIPNVQKQLMLSRETAALSTLRALQTAQTQHYAQFGRYADSPAALGPPQSGQENASAAGLIPEDLAAGDKGGYVFHVEGSAHGYAAMARPAKPGSSGRRSFFTDQTMVIREQWGGEPATPRNKPI